MGKINNATSGGRSVSAGALVPRNNRGNTSQIASYWSGGGVSFMVATGGTTTTYTLNGFLYKSHTFSSSGTFTVSDAGSTPTIDVLVMGGGGGGGSLYGGGGHGGYGNIATQTLSATAYTVTVGGTGYQAPHNSYENGGAGGTSTFNGVSGAGGEGGIANNNNYSNQSGNITSNSYRTGSAEVFADGGYRAPTNSYGVGIYGRGGSGAMVYCNVSYYGGQGNGGVVIIRYVIG